MPDYVAEILQTRRFSVPFKAKNDDEARILAEDIQLPDQADSCEEEVTSVWLATEA